MDETRAGYKRRRSPERDDVGPYSSREIGASGRSSQSLSHTQSRSYEGGSRREAPGRDAVASSRDYGYDRDRADDRGRGLDREKERDSDYYRDRDRDRDRDYDRDRGRGAAYGYGRGSGSDWRDEERERERERERGAGRRDDGDRRDGRERRYDRDGRGGYEDDRDGDRRRAGDDARDRRGDGRGDAERARPMRPNAAPIARILESNEGARQPSGPRKDIVRRPEPSAGSPESPTPPPSAVAEPDMELDEDGVPIVEDEESRAARLLDESKRRREAIMAKYKNGGAGPAQDSTKSAPSTAAAAPAAPSHATRDSVASPTTRASTVAHPIGAQTAAAEVESAVAAPLATASGSVLTSTQQLALPTVVAKPTVSMFDSEDEETPDREDMIAAGALNRATNAAAVAAAAASLMDTSANPTLLDNWDDHEGYYKVMVGELLEDRYRVQGTRGRGVFSTVLYCRDELAVERERAELDDDAAVEAGAQGTITTAAAPVTVGSAGGLMRHHAALATGSSNYVAIKVIRNNDRMRRAAAKELEILRAIATADPDGRYHCVRLLHTFEHRNHICLVFEPMHMNLKEVQNKFGKGVGISINAVCAYAKQMLLALGLLGKLRIIHADIKPHNILANERYNVVKVADFGSAFREDDPDNEPTPYLVSRFYRAPEIILGYKHSPALDMWSVACCLYELYTGHPLFPGEDNNDMLWRIQCTRGPFPHRLLKFHLRQCESMGLEAHFDADLRFCRKVVDPVSKVPLVKHVVVTAPTEDLAGKLLEKRAAEDDKRMVLHLKDLLEKMTVLDPAKRITVKEALGHPFIKSK